MKTLLGNHAPASAQDAVLLLARVLLGVVLITHGWQKVVTNGFGATADGFDMMGIPAPYAAAVFAGLVTVHRPAGVRVAGDTLVVGDLGVGVGRVHRPHLGELAVALLLLVGHGDRYPAQPRRHSRSKNAA